MFDYQEMPTLPRAGIKGDGVKLMTVGLFIETCQEGNESKARYTLGEDEVKVGDKWLPSAYMIYIHAPSEYEAMRRITGNPRQWEMLKELKWFNEHLRIWEYERTEIQKARVQSMLEAVMVGADKDATAVTAAKALLAMVAPKPVKPAVAAKAKAKAADAAKAVDEVDNDFDRVVPLR